MTPLEMIEEWRNGCSCGSVEHPEDCTECTRALIDALERRLLLIQARIQGDEVALVVPK